MRVHNEFAGLVKRFDAVNGKAVLSENRCNEEILKRVWDASMNAKYSSKAQPGTKTMSDGEVGCALSHVELWKILTSTESSSENPVMMVLEDDAVFSSVAVDLDSQMCWRKLWRTFRVAGAFSTWDFLAEENGIT